MELFRATIFHTPAGNLACYEDGGLLIRDGRVAACGDFETVLAAMRNGKVPMAALATHAGGIDEAPQLIPGWSRPEAGVIKAIVDV